VTSPALPGLGVVAHHFHPGGVDLSAVVVERRGCLGDLLTYEAGPGPYPAIGVEVDRIELYSRITSR
jgi:hypothetical protein